MYKLGILLLFVVTIATAAPSTPVKLWISPTCSTGDVQAINDARWQAKRAYQQLLPSQENSKWLSTYLEWFFNIKVTADLLSLARIRDTLNRIASMERVIIHDEALVKFYCENQDSFKTLDGEKAPEVIEDKHKELFYVHEKEQLILNGHELYCRKGASSVDGQAQSAIEGEHIISYKDRWNEFYPNKSFTEPTMKGIVWLCDKRKRLKDTIKDLTDEVLQSLSTGNLAEYILISSVVLHELVHIALLSRQTFNKDVDPTGFIGSHGRDFHRRTLKSTKVRNGYYFPGKALPRTSLQMPEFTIMNPDSYRPLGLFIALASLGYEVKDTMTWRQAYPVLQAFKNKDWKVDKDALQWPTDQGWDWTDRVTPEEVAP